MTTNNGLTDRQKKWMDKWEYWHRKSMWRYIITNGITWGILTASLVTLFYRWHYQVCEDTYSLIMRFGMFILAGLPYAYTLWVINEKRYRKYQTRQEAQKTKKKH